MDPGKGGFGGPDPSKVRVYGDGVKPTGVSASIPVSFMVDTTEAGNADVDVIIKVEFGFLSIVI